MVFRTFVFLESHVVVYFYNQLHKFPSVITYFVLYVYRNARREQLTFNSCRSLRVKSIQLHMGGELYIACMSVNIK